MTGDPRPGGSIPVDLVAMLAGFDAAFREDSGARVGDFFAEDARLQWPEEEDIIGREAIRAAFVDFTTTFHTISWEPSYQVADAHGDRAYLLGRFVELRGRRGNDDVERVPGRFVYFCRREVDGAWRITHALTSRYGEISTERIDDG